MNLSITKDKAYAAWLKELGQAIVEKQKNTVWGDGFLQQLSTDLSTEFPDKYLTKSFRVFFNA